MAWSFLTLLPLTFILPMALFTKLPAQLPLSRMGLWNANPNIYLRQPELFPFNLKSLFSFGEDPF